MTKPDTNCISYWFPKVSGLVPCPETRIIRTELPLWQLLDGAEVSQQLLDGTNAFIKQLADAARSLGGAPVFLRTGHTSGKHRWRLTCCVTDLDYLPRHVGALVEESELADIMDLPTNVWAVRRMLKTEPAFHAYNGMPITREFRVFVRDGRIEHWQPYWPPGAFEAAGANPDAPDWLERLAKISKLGLYTGDVIFPGTRDIGRALGGYWSVDWLYAAEQPGDKIGKWFMIDMADGEQSFRREPKT